jgi:anti-sigma28 factor (negative regulator of flagellin synthesis)
MSKGFSGKFLPAGDFVKTPLTETFGPAKFEKALFLKQMGEEADVQNLLKFMEREYRQSELFRRDRVLEIKKLIQKGQYHVPGKQVVEKWFPG